MHQSTLVGRLQTQRCLPNVAGRAVYRHWAELGDDVLEGGTIHVIHYEEMEPVILVDVMALDQIGVFEDAGCTRLTIETTQRRGIVGFRGRQYLDGNLSVDHQVFAKV